MMSPDSEWDLEPEIPDEDESSRGPGRDREGGWTDLQCGQQPQRGIQLELEGLLTWSSRLHPEIPTSETSDLCPVHQDGFPETLEMLHSSHTPFRLFIDAHDLRRGLVPWSGELRSTSLPPWIRTFRVSDLEHLDCPSFASARDRVAALTHTQPRDSTPEIEHGFTLAPGCPGQLLAVPDSDCVIRRPTHQEQIVPGDREMGHGLRVFQECRQENSLSTGWDGRAQKKTHLR